MNREQIEVQASADYESRQYDPNNAPTFAWAGQKLHYIGGECEEVRFESGRTLVHLFNPQQPRSGGVCPTRDNAAMLGRELVRRWNAYPNLLAAARAVSECPDYRGINTHEMDNLRAALANATLIAAAPDAVLMAQEIVALADIVDADTIEDLRCWLIRAGAAAREWLAKAEAV